MKKESEKGKDYLDKLMKKYSGKKQLTDADLKGLIKTYSKKSHIPQVSHIKSKKVKASIKHPKRVKKSFNFPKRSLTVIVLIAILLIICILAVLLYEYMQNPENKFKIGANIKDTYLSPDGKMIYVKLLGGVNDNNITSVDFLLKDSSGKEYNYRTSEGAKEISIPYKTSWINLFIKPLYKGNYDYSISADKLGLENLKEITEISVSFIYKTPEEKSIETPILDTKKPTIARPINRSSSSGGGGGSGGGGNTNPTCTPNCPGKTCGDDGCGGSCGICNSTQNCIDGICNDIINCTNDLGCSSIGIFCDMNLSYNCSLGIDGCIQKQNLSSCSVGYQCINGIGCSEIKDCITDNDCSYLNDICGYGKCNSANKCEIQFNLSTNICRAASGDCDITQKCTGNSTVCPANSFKELGDSCESNKFCNGAGDCVNCNKNLDCGIDESKGDLFCDSNNVFQNFTIYACNNPGTLTSSCTSSTLSELNQTCTSIETCENGQCTPNCIPGNVCRASSGDCDIPEYYDNNCNCPADSKANDGTACPDDSCNTNRICTSGVCGGGNPISPLPPGCSCTKTQQCPEATEQCKEASCVEGVCGTENKNNGTICNNTNPCLINNICSSGACEGKQKTCTPSSDCKLSNCNSLNGNCDETNKPDNTPCTIPSGLYALSPFLSFLKLFGLDIGILGQDGICNEGVCVNIPNPPPSIDFLSQTPTDLNMTNVENNPMKISYRITSVNLNDSTVKLYYKTNSTADNRMFFLNGTALEGYFTADIRSNISSDYMWTLSDNEIYPGNYNTDPLSIDNKIHAFTTISNNQYYIKTEYYNISGIKQWAYFEIMATSTASASPINLYYCNSSYTTGNISANNNCALVSTRKATTSFDHCLTNNSCYIGFQFAINTTSQRIGNVKVTSTSYFLIGGNSNWYVYNIPEITRTGMTTRTNNGGSGWAARTYTVDQHLHQFDNNKNQIFYYYVCADDTSSPPLENCSEIRSDLIETF